MGALSATLAPGKNERLCSNGSPSRQWGFPWLLPRAMLLAFGPLGRSGFRFLQSGWWQLPQVASGAGQPGQPACLSCSSCVQPNQQLQPTRTPKGPGAFC